jgi:uncharacterized membrane protein
MTSDPPVEEVTPLRVSAAARLRNYFLAGILVTAPISITAYFTWSVVSWVDEGVARVLPAYLHSSIPGLGVVILLATLTIIGFLTANFLGQALIDFGERILARMPLIRSIYSAVKQIFETVLKDQSMAFREVILVEFPRSGMWTLGLVVSRATGEIRDKLPEDMLTVFVPTAPNPTSGYLVFMPQADAIKLDMTVEEALKIVVSGGLVTPSGTRKVPI